MSVKRSKQRFVAAGVVASIVLAPAVFTGIANAQCPGPDPSFDAPGIEPYLQFWHDLMASPVCNDDANSGGYDYRDWAMAPHQSESLFVTMANAALDGPDATADTIEFGANTSEGAGDGVCGDPRFENEPTTDTPRMTGDAAAADMFRDARDCRDAYEAGAIRVRGRVDGIDFGTDVGPRDYVCRDPRFAPLVTVGQVPAEATADAERAYASDCRLAYIAEQVGIWDVTHRVVFGNDRGEWPNDDECDDPRFRAVPGARQAGAPRMAESANAKNVGRDATDCRRAMAAESIELRPNGARDGVDFGDDSGRWPFDFECDDPRFENAGDFDADAAIAMSQVAPSDHRGMDATDCRGAYDDGSVVFTVVEDLDGIRFGDNESHFAYDGECDDPRFEDVNGTEARMASNVEQENWARDAVDCFRAYRDGGIRLKRD